MLLPPPPPPPPPLFPPPVSSPTSLILPLFTLSIFPASHTDEQMLPRDRLDINDYWLLTPNQTLLCDQWRISLWWKSHLSQTESRGWVCGLSLKRETPETANENNAWILWVACKGNEVRGVKDLPSGAVEEHNSLWPCHEGAPLQTCRQEERGYKHTDDYSAFLFCGAHTSTASRCVTLSNT